MTGRGGSDAAITARDDQTDPEADARWWIPLSAGAMVASAAHIGIDFAADVYPRDAIGYVLVGVTAVVLYVLWIVALGRAAAGSGGAIKFASVAALVHAGLANGFVGFFPCPPVALWGGEPPCAFSPWQDLAHLGSLVFGVAAFVVLRRHAVESPRGDRTFMATGFAVLVLHTVLTAVVAAST